MSQGVRAPERAAGSTGGVLTWLMVVAVMSVVVAVWKVGTWVNHWYIAERFLVPVTGGAEDGLGWRQVADLLRTGNQDLATGLGWLGFAALLVTVAVVVRRRRVRRG